MIDKDFNSREAFNEVIDNLEIINSLTDYGKKLIKQGVIDLRIENQKYREIINEAIKKVDVLRRKYAKNITPIPCTEIEDIDRILKETIK
mgnify:CR=1 FL=1|nr:MAG TPA: hypothetical protein [Caudoviricetes sp.]